MGADTNYARPDWILDYARKLVRVGKGRHASESRHPACLYKFNIWIPAFAGMTAG
jgi:hypothetical protein